MSALRAHYPRVRIGNFPSGVRLNSVPFSRTKSPLSSSSSRVTPLHSVMQSDGNSFGGNVVLDSFNKVCRDRDSILDQKYEKQISENFNFRGD